MKPAPIAIVDCNSFYASCEKVFRPDLKDKPVVVVSNNDGVIVALSSEAKSIGIRGFTPYYQAKEILKKYGVTVFSSNYSLYEDMSYRVMTTLEKFSPNVEIYSIDEAFLNLSGLERYDLTEYCRKIKDTVMKWTGIPVSIGIAPTKTLAKLANRRAKKDSKNVGVLNLIDNPDLDKHLMNTDVSDIWGIGRKYSKLLKAFSITNANDLKRANQQWIKKKLTVHGLRTVLELNGQPCISLDDIRHDKKAIVSSRSFSRYVTEKQDLIEAISTYTVRAAEKLRKQRSAAKFLSVFIRTNPFAEVRQYHNGCQITLPQATDVVPELIEHALQALNKIYRQGYSYQKAGILLAGLEPSKSSQYDLFEPPTRMSKIIATETVDKINEIFGKGTVFYASQGIARQWSMKREMESPHYTTQWDSLANVK